MVSATHDNGLAGLRSSESSTSSTARSETWLATLRNRRSTSSRRSSVTGVLRPLTSICIGRLRSGVCFPSTDGAGLVHRCQRTYLSGRTGIRRESARPGQRDDLAGPRATQRAGARVERGARGVHVVDEQHPGRGRASRRERRCAAAPGARRATRRAGCARARGAAAAGASRASGAARERAGEQPGLVVPAPAQRAPGARAPARSSRPRAATAARPRRAAPP